MTLDTIARPAFDPAVLKREFPGLADPDLHYLDNAATAQMPEDVLQALRRFEIEARANVHEGAHRRARAATAALHEARSRAATFLHAWWSDEVVFTCGTTSSINLLAHSFGASLRPGDEILLSVLEHHSNLVPWQRLPAKRTLTLRFLPVTDEGRIDMGALHSELTSRCRLVAMTHCSNVTGALTDVARLVGAAMAGLRPIVEIMTVNFSLLALDQIVNNAATIPHMSGGQFAVPLVIRMATGAGRQLAAQHSHSLEGWYAHIPGLKVVAPATLEDARGMLGSALQDPNPVLIFEHVNLYNLEGELAADAGSVPLAGAAVRRSGRDLSLVTYGASLHKSLTAAEQLAAEGIEAEVIDLRSLRPLDDETIMSSLARTRRVLVVDEGWRSGGISAEICARVAEQGFYDLDAPPARLCGAEVPIPYPKHLEDASIPQVDTIRAAALELVRPQRRAA